MKVRTEVAILSTSMGQWQHSHTPSAFHALHYKITKDGVLKSTGKVRSLQKSAVQRKGKFVGHIQVN